MEIPSHPTVEELREAIRARRGVGVACNVCGGEEFSMEEVALVDARGGYGTHRLKRADLVCEGCGHVMGFELDKLRRVED